MELADEIKELAGRKYLLGDGILSIHSTSLKIEQLSHAFSTYLSEIGRLDHLHVKEQVFSCGDVFLEYRQGIQSIKVIENLMK